VAGVLVQPRMAAFCPLWAMLSPTVKRALPETFQLGWVVSSVACSKPPSAMASEQVAGVGVGVGVSVGVDVGVGVDGVLVGVGVSVGVGVGVSVGAGVEVASGVVTLRAVSSTQARLTWESSVWTKKPKSTVWPAT